MSNKKILYFTKYSRLGASSRLRSYQYFPLLKEDGIEVVAKPLFDSSYIEDLLNNKKSYITTIKSYLSRLISLFTIYKYDYIVIEKELFPFVPAFFERIIVLLGFKYSVIYDDAIFHYYDMSYNKTIRFLFKKKIDSVMKYSNCVIAGNNYLKNKAIESGAKKIVVIPTVIDLDRYGVVNKNNQNDFIIGWIGSPSTFHYLKGIAKSLKKIIEKYDVKIHIIGTKEKLDLPDKNVKYIDWSEESEVAEIQKFTVGIMPLVNNSWELGKCSYKLIQYMGCGIPVLASPIGMNTEVVEHGVNGYLAENEEDWFLYFEKFINEPALNIKMGNNGRKLIEERFSLNGTYEAFKSSITELPF